MSRWYELRTSRSKSGKARAEITKFFNYSQMKAQYAFEFYRDFKCFDTFDEAKAYMESEYEVIREF